MCSSKYAAAFFNSLPESFTRSKSTPTSRNASGREIPFLSFKPRASSRFKLPEHADEPNKLFPKRAPSSSAQSTRRMVIGGLPLYCELIRRKISKLAKTFRQPSSQPPFGTESMCPPMSKDFSDSPRNVVHKFPAASVWISTGNSESFFLSQLRAAIQVGVNATRC